MARKGKRLVIKGGAVGAQKGRLKGRLKNNRSNKGDWKSGRKRKR